MRSREAAGTRRLTSSVPRVVLLLLVLGVWPWAAARAQDLTARGFEMEREGRWGEAAAAFTGVLAHDPANVPALLGAERVYAQLGQRDSVLPLVRRALAVDSTNMYVRQIELRTARALGGEAAAADVLRRWLAAAPHSEAPYRELVRSLVALGRPEDARAAVAQARAVLGDTALRAEAAAAAVLSGDWPRAAAEWRGAVAADPAMITAARFSLQGTPADARPRLVRALTDPDTSLTGRRIAAELLVGWQDAPRAWALLQRALPDEARARDAMLRSFADRARNQPGAPAERVAGEALERLAGDATGADAARLRIESARAFWEAGDNDAARRMLAAIADDPASPPDVAASSVGALIEMSVRAGDVAAAADLLRQRRDRLPEGQALAFGLTIARGWLARGELAHAEATVAPDSSLAADAIRGWAALYRGDVATARDLLRASGASPDAEGGAERAAVVALLAAADADTSVSLGAALERAGRGDTAGAAQALAALAGGSDPALQSDQARAAALEVAARFAAAAHDSVAADTLWRRIADQLPGTPPAPAAMLAVARGMAARGDIPGATHQLEAMILRYPASALVPEARRELDRVRGLVPRS